MDGFTLALLTLATFVTAAFSAVVGLGGGVTLLAVMATLMPPALVVPLHGVVQLVSNSTRAGLLAAHVHRRIFAYYMVAAICGVAIGARFYLGGAVSWFRPAVGLFVLGYLATLARKPRLGRIPIPAFALVGFSVGTLASLIGATGPLNAPFFVRDDLSKRQVIATQASVQIATHGAKIPVFVALGFDYTAHLATLAPLVLAAVAGTMVGKHLLAGVSEQTFRRVFVAVLALVSIKLIFG